MEFSQKLTLLMHVYKFSNSFLARSIHVDPSLISRWKSGTRKISSHSPHIAALATFFIQTDAYPYQKTYLNRLMNSLMHQDPNEVSEADQSLALANWLTDSDALWVPNEPDKFLFSDHSNQMISQISQWLAPGSQKVLPADPLHSDNSQAEAPAAAAHPFSGQLYFGMAGKRQAVLDFLDAAINAQEPLEFFLFSEELMNWLTDDPSFTRRWAQRLRQVIEAGHTITIIHVVNRSAQEILRIINQWLPLHLSGQIRSFYDPRYKDPAIRQTLFILSGQAVLTAQSTEDINTQSVCFAARHPDVIKYYTQIFHSYLQQCQPLFSGCSARQYQEHLQTQLMMSKRANRVIAFLHQPEIDFLSAAAQSKLFNVLQQTTNVQNRSILVSFFNRNRFRHGETIHLLSRDWLDTAVRDGALIQSDCHLFFNAPIRLTFAETEHWLRQIIRHLENNLNHHLYFIDSTSDSNAQAHCFRYYERHCAVFASFPAEDPFVISISEANSLHALGLYLDRVITRIPHAYKDRQTVLQILASAADQLSAKSE